MTPLSGQTMKVATRDDIINITKKADALHYNRILHDQAVKDLDPDGANVLIPAMMHEYAEGVPVDPHMRAFVYLSVIGTDEPVRSIIDVPIETWSALPKANLSQESDPRNG